MRLQKTSEHNLQIWMRKCRHFTGVQYKVCKAGVNYDDVVPIPCIGLDNTTVKQAVCEKKSCWTREEAIGIEKEKAESMKRFFLALGAASDDAEAKGYKKGNGGKDSLPCPVCKTGTLHYSVASYNGHLWGQCTTKDCVSWMQ
jgi:hypothetical protein